MEYFSWISLLFWLTLGVVAEPKTSTSFELPEPTPSTIIDILSSQAQYSYFLRHLQRSGLVPSINAMENVTILAPINSAFIGFNINKNKKTDYEDDNAEESDWLRYIVGQIFRVGYLGREEVVFNTLYHTSANEYYPVSVIPNFENFEYVVDGVSPIIEPDIYAKHQHSFVQGIEHLIPIKPTLCQLLMDERTVEFNSRKIGHFKKLVKSLFARSGDEDDDYVGVENAIGPLAKKGQNKKKSKHKSKGKNDKNNKHKKKIPKKKKKNKQDPIVLPETCEEFLGGSKSVFIPDDDLLEDSLPELVLRYYLSSYHALYNPKFTTTKEALHEMRTDIYTLLSDLVIKGVVAGQNGTGSQVHKSHSKHIKYVVKLNHTDGKVVVNDKLTSSTSSVLADGAIHIFSKHSGTNFFHSLKIPTVEMIPRKGLYAMHFSNFVKELKFRSLDYLVDGSTSNQTIFVASEQRDDIPEEDTVDFRVSSFSNKQGLMYQFADEAIDLSTFLDSNKVVHKLLDSKLCSKKKVGGCFKLKFSASNSNSKVRATVNDEIEILSPATNVGNNSLVYVTDKDIDPPSNFKNSLGELISSGSIPRHLDHLDIDKKSCLSTLGYLNQFDLFSLSDNSKGYSVFLPCAPANSALISDKDLTYYASNESKGNWKNLGLILNYLEANPTVFDGILKGFFIEDTIYSDFGLEGRKKRLSTDNMRGDPVKIESDLVSADNHYINLNETRLTLPLNSDILFNQGVIHLVDQVLLPENFSVSLPDLLKTTVDPNYPKNSIINMLDDFPKLKKALGLVAVDGTFSHEFSLLVPSSESLKDFNITSGFSRLFDFFELHLIPNSELGNLLDCVTNKKPPPIHHGNSTHSSNEFVIKTNYSSVELSCSNNSKKGKIFLRLKTPPESQDGSVQKKKKSEIGTFSYNLDHEVKLISHGCTSLHYSKNSTDNISCVFLIEKPLNLQWLHHSRKDNFLHIHLGFVSVGVGIILGLAIFGGVMIGAIFCLGNNKKKFETSNTLDDSLFPRSESSFMRVLTDDDTVYYDRGYETDIDILRTETEHLLPLYGKKKRKIKRKEYGTTNSSTRGIDGVANNDTVGTVSAPRTIRKANVSKTFRERNFPGASQF